MFFILEMLSICNKLLDLERNFIRWGWNLIVLLLVIFSVLRCISDVMYGKEIFVIDE